MPKKGIKILDLIVKVQHPEWEISAKFIKKNKLILLRKDKYSVNKCDSA